MEPTDVTRIPVGGESPYEVLVGTDVIGACFLRLVGFVTFGDY